jgi:hypothetical protein
MQKQPSMCSHMTDAGASSRQTTATLKQSPSAPVHIDQTAMSIDQIYQQAVHHHLDKRH